MRCSKSVLKFVVMAICAAILTVTKLALSFIPNVETVTMLIILYTLLFGFGKSLIITFVFVIVEGFLYGFELHFIQYLFVWPVLVILTKIFAKYIKEDFILWSIFSGAYGMLFGTLCSIPLIIIDKTFAFSYIISGIIFDAIHMVGNCLIMLFLGEIIYNRLKEMIYRLNL